MAQNKAADLVDAFVEKVYDYNALFTRVEIETYNRCNGVCSFCPVNKNADTRPECRMKTNVFYKIIDELHAMNYNGSISIYSNNEPLLDDRIVEFHKYCREKLPKATMYLHTNGTLLTLDKFIELIDNLDELIIDNYQQDLKLIRPVEIIRQYCELHEELKKKVTIVMRKPNEILSTRESMAPNRVDKVSYGMRKCNLPFQQIVIRPDGSLSLCCNDALGTITMGNVTDNNLMTIWNSDQYKAMRVSLYEGRNNVSICRYCDNFHRLL